MKRAGRRRAPRFTFVAAALTVAARFAAGEGAALPAHPVATATALQILTTPVAAAAGDATQLRRGQALVVAGDCMSCHLRPGGEPLAGGLGLKTPFGTIYSANITPDPDTGIGRWTSDQFYGAMHDGVDDEGHNLYPAFPYPWFRKLSRADDDAVFAYLKSLPPVRYTPPKNELPFPLNVRVLVKGWNLAFFHTSDWHDDPTQSAEWNRGAFLVEGPGHCGACHTPKNVLGAGKRGQDLQGGNLDNWVAPDLTDNERTGLGRWSVAEIAEFLKTGRNAHANAGGAMAEVITYSTSLLGDEDRHAIAVYLKSRAPSSRVAPTAAPEGGRRHAPRRRHLLRRLLGVSPRRRDRPAALLPAARQQRDAAAGRRHGPRAFDPRRQSHRSQRDADVAADDAELCLEAFGRRDRRRCDLCAEQLGQPRGGRQRKSGSRSCATSSAPARAAADRSTRETASDIQSFGLSSASSAKAPATSIG